MSKFNTRSARPAATSPVFSETTPSGLTHEGAAGYARDVQSGLFLLAVSNMVGEHTFYENADNRDTRYAELVREAAVNYPDWTARFLRWLRHEANMRTASLVGAAEFVKARLDFGESCESVTNRSVIGSVLRRADEPGEMLAYWAEMYGRAFRMPVKRGVADAILRLGTEFNYVKWDSEGRGYRFADLLNLTHPGDRKGSAQRIRGELQHALFDYIVKKPYQSGLPVPEILPMLTRRQALLDLPVDERHTALDNPSRLRAAGMTWESLAGWLQGPMDAAAWEAIIPSMGLMALVRNLRNFDNSGVSDDVAAQVADRIADPDQVTGAKLFPMQFLSAYRSAPSLRWAWALEQAITHSLANVPRLEGNTLVLIDTSGSMADRFSKDGSLARWDAAAVFGLALGSRCASADVVSFSAGSPWSDNSTKVFDLREDESLLKAVDRWASGGFFLGGGSDTEGALRTHFRGHDRVVILTDEQVAYDGDVGRALPASTPLYTWNLAGYRYGHAPSGDRHRHTFGGLTDQGFAMIPLLEAGHDAKWPF